MDQIALPNRLFAKDDDVEVVVFAHRLIEVKLALYLTCLHHLIIIFVSDLFF